MKPAGFCAASLSTVKGLDAGRNALKPTEADMFYDLLLCDVNLSIQLLLINTHRFYILFQVQDL